MHRELESSVALVTGAGRGIGRAIALHLCEAGCKVALLARSEAELAETRAACEAIGGTAITLPVDVTRAGDLQPAVARTVSELGPLRFLVNNAGSFYYQHVEQADLLAWDLAIDTNLRSLMHLTFHAIPELKKTAEPAIVNIASNASKTSYTKGSAYCASKHGVLGFARSVFEDVREDGIRVSTICPQFVDTAMVSDPTLKRDRMIQPDDIARTLMFVLTLPARACPTEIDIYPQRDPRRA